MEVISQLYFRHAFIIDPDKTIRYVKILRQKKRISHYYNLIIIIAIEFSRFCIMYLLIKKTITPGPARNPRSQGVLYQKQDPFKRKTL